MPLLTCGELHGILFFERRSRSDCVHEQVAKRIANIRLTRRSRSDCVHEQVAKLGPVSRAAGMYFNIRFTKM